MTKGFDTTHTEISSDAIIPQVTTTTQDTLSPQTRLSPQTEIREAEVMKEAIEQGAAIGVTIPTAEAIPAGAIDQAAIGVATSAMPAGAVDQVAITGAGETQTTSHNPTKPSLTKINPISSFKRYWKSSELFRMIVVSTTTAAIASAIVYVILIKRSPKIATVDLTYLSNSFVTNLALQQMKSGATDDEVRKTVSSFLSNLDVLLSSVAAKGNLILLQKQAVAAGVGKDITKELEQVVLEKITQNHSEQNSDSSNHLKLSQNFSQDFSRDSRADRGSDETSTFVGEDDPPFKAQIVPNLPPQQSAQNYSGDYPEGYSESEQMEQRAGRRRPTHSSIASLELLDDRSIPETNNRRNNAN